MLPIVIVFPTGSLITGPDIFPGSTASPITTFCISFLVNVTVVPSILNVFDGNSVGFNTVPTASMSAKTCVTAFSVVDIPAISAIVPLSNSGSVVTPVNSISSVISDKPVESTIHLYNLPLYLTCCPSL